MPHLGKCHEKVTEFRTRAEQHEKIMYGFADKQACSGVYGHGRNAQSARLNGTGEFLHYRGMSVRLSQPHYILLKVMLSIVRFSAQADAAQICTIAITGSPLM